MSVWPELVPAWACNAKITVMLFNGKNADGEETYREVYSGRCNYSEKSKSVLDSQKRQVLLAGTALISGDIAPGSDLSGEVEISIGDAKLKRRILQGSRARNLDGTVNFTQLELI